MLDLVLVAYEFGLHAAPGPLGPTNLVAAALGRWGSDEQQSGLLASSALGREGGRVGIGGARPRTTGLGQVGLEAQTEGDSVVLAGAKSPVESR